MARRRKLLVRKNFEYGSVKASQTLNGWSVCMHVWEWEGWTEEDVLALHQRVIAMLHRAHMKLILDQQKTPPQDDQS